MATKSKTKASAAGTVIKTKRARAKGVQVLKRIGAADHVVDLSKYERVRSVAGNSSLDNGDDVAKQLRGVELDKVYAVVSKHTKIPVKQLRTNYSHLNVGMQRMNLGNKLRGALNQQAG